MRHLRLILLLTLATILNELAYSHGGLTPFTFEENNFYVWVCSRDNEIEGLEYGEAAITGYRDHFVKSVTIPEEIRGYAIVAIIEGGFNTYDLYYDEWIYGSNIEEITMPESIRTICNGAFAGCANLKSLNIPESIKSIESYTFATCRRLTKFMIPDNVKHVGHHAFINCFNLEYISLPSDLDTIHAGTFKKCKSLKRVNFGNSETKSTQKNIDLGSSRIKSIGEAAFYGCSELEIDKLPHGLVEIGDSAFYGCSKIDSIYLPSTFEYAEPDNESGIPGKGFNQSMFDNTALKNIAVSENNPFYASYKGVLYRKDMSELVMYPGGKEEYEFTVPNSVTTIGEGALAYTTNLKSLTLQQNVKELKKNSILVPQSLYMAGIYDAESGIPDATDAFVNPLDIANSTLYVSESNYDEFRTTSPWSGFGKIVAFDFSGIDSIESNQSISIRTENGRIIIDGMPKGVNSEIYDLDGKLILVSSDSEISGLDKGIYIIRIGNFTGKAAI